MPSSKIIRIQDTDGRGPWRPGFSYQWIGDDTPTGMPAISHYPKALAAAVCADKRGLHVGCAVYDIDIGKWFSPRDIEKLKSLGFAMVDASRCTVLFSAPGQVLIGSELPLKFLPRCA